MGPIETMYLGQQIHGIAAAERIDPLKRASGRRLLVVSPPESSKHIQRIRAVAGRQQIEGHLVRITTCQRAIKDPLPMVSDERSAKEHEMSIQRTMAERMAEPDGQAETHF